MILLADSESPNQTALFAYAGQSEDTFSHGAANLCKMFPF